jgi:hypothetical protein
LQQLLPRVSANDRGEEALETQWRRGPERRECGGFSDAGNGICRRLRGAPYHPQPPRPAMPCNHSPGPVTLTLITLARRAQAIGPLLSPRLVTAASRRNEHSAEPPPSLLERSLEKGGAGRASFPRPACPALPGRCSRAGAQPRHDGHCFRPVSRLSTSPGRPHAFPQGPKCTQERGDRNAEAKRAGGCKTGKEKWKGTRSKPRASKSSALVLHRCPCQRQAPPATGH